MFLTIPLTIGQHWLRWWLGIENMWSCYFHQGWPGSLTYMGHCFKRSGNHSSNLTYFPDVTMIILFSINHNGLESNRWPLFIPVSNFTCYWITRDTLLNHTMLTLNPLKILVIWISIHVTRECLCAIIFQNSTGIIILYLQYFKFTLIVPLLLLVSFLRNFVPNAGILGMHK